MPRRNTSECHVAGEQVSVALVDDMGRELRRDGSDSAGGSRVAAIEVHGKENGAVRCGASC